MWQLAGGRRGLLLYQPKLCSYSMFNLVSMVYSTNNLIEFSEPKLWHAVFINDYSELQLYNHQKALMMSVHVHNWESAGMIWLLHCLLASVFYCGPFVSCSQFLDYQAIRWIRLVSFALPLWLLLFLLFSRTMGSSSRDMPNYPLKEPRTQWNITKRLSGLAKHDPFVGPLIWRVGPEPQCGSPLSSSKEKQRLDLVW